MTLMVANQLGSHGTNYQVLTAAIFISMVLPLVIFFSRPRYFVYGFSLVLSKASSNLCKAVL
jgi:alpha-glucoside transport system permease protein